MRTLSSPVASQVVVVTTCDVTSDDKVGIITTLSFHGGHVDILYDLLYVTYGGYHVRYKAFVFAFVIIISTPRGSCETVPHLQRTHMKEIHAGCLRVLLKSTFPLVVTYA